MFEDDVLCFNASSERTFAVKIASERTTQEADTVVRLDSTGRLSDNHSSTKLELLIPFSA